MHSYGCLPTELYKTLKCYAAETKYPYESSSIKQETPRYGTSKYLAKITYIHPHLC